MTPLLSSVLLTKARHHFTFSALKQRDYLISSFLHLSLCLESWTWTPIHVISIFILFYVVSSSCRHQKLHAAQWLVINTVAMTEGECWQRHEPTWLLLGGLQFTKYDQRDHTIACRAARVISETVSFSCCTGALWPNCKMFFFLCFFCLFVWFFWDPSCIL